jgi:hypothetical protein
MHSAGVDDASHIVMPFLDEVEGSEDETENEAIVLKVPVIYQNYIRLKQHNN